MADFRVIEITDPNEAMGIQGLPFAVKVYEPHLELTVLGFRSRAEAEGYIVSQKRAAPNG